MTRLRSYLANNPIFFRIVFCISFATSLGLFLGGFFCPPMGAIDGSVLTAGGILMGFCVCAMVPDMIAAGKSATIKHGETSITISSNNPTTPEDVES